MSDLSSKERGCYVMEGVTYTSHEDGSETSRKATNEEVLLSDALLAALDQRNQEMRLRQAAEKAALARTAHEPPAGIDELYLMLVRRGYAQHEADAISKMQPPALNRYSIEMEGDICGAVKVEKLDPNGEWVLFEDVVPYVRTTEPPAVTPLAKAACCFAGKVKDSYILKLWFESQEDLDAAFDLVDDAATILPMVPIESPSETKPESVSK